MNARTTLRTLFSISIALLPCVQGFAAVDAKCPASVDSSPLLVAYVTTNAPTLHQDFPASAFQKEGRGRVFWENWGPAINKAHKTYLQAFKASTLSEKRKLLP